MHNTNKNEAIKNLTEKLILKNNLRIENLKVDYRRQLRKKTPEKAIVTANKIKTLKERNNELLKELGEL